MLFRTYRLRPERLARIRLAVQLANLIQRDREKNRDYYLVSEEFAPCYSAILRHIHDCGTPSLEYQTFQRVYDRHQIRNRVHRNFAYLRH